MTPPVSQLIAEPGRFVWEDVHAEDQVAGEQAESVLTRKNHLALQIPTEVPSKHLSSSSKAMKG